MENMSDTKVISVGDKLPELKFEVFYKGESQKVDLKDFDGKWKLFFFYPADFTFVCPTELEEMADNYDEFVKEGIEIFSVSNDTVFTHKAWHDKSPAIGKIKFPMIGDPSGKLSKLFGTYIEEGDDEGLSLRGTFIVDEDNIIKSVEINDNSIGRSAKECLRKVKAAKYVASHNGQVCPAGWNPGDDTLKPGMDLVGKI
jgi:peroxiredoxin (alkyl hydroperoxide reductase subunit C)